MRTMYPKAKAGFILILSCSLFMNQYAAVFAQEEDTVTESTAETSVEEISAAENVSAGKDAVLQQILEALDTPVYSETYEALKGGETVASGTNGSTAGGVQQTLVDLGCDISVDSMAGPATLGAVNQVLQEFGEEETDTVDDAVYADLLSYLLLSKDNDGSYENLLMDYFGGEEDEGRYQYLKGCAFLQTEHYYKAMEAFGNSSYADAKERMQACEQPLPETGELWHNSEVIGQDMYLTFKVNSPDEARGMCFEVYTEDGTLAAVLFQKGSGSVTTKLPGGNYRIRDASGDTWYGRADSFGPEGSYEFMVFDEFEDDEYLTRLDSGYEWAISINMQGGGPDAAGVGSEQSSWEDWTN